MIELLAPAGDLERLKVALLYGADAVYVGGTDYSLRANAKNFSLDDLKTGVDFAHNLGKRVYVTVNIVPHNADTLGIVNVALSSIARACDNVLYTNAGPEIAVATTKAYSMQVLMLSLIALNIGVSKNLIDKDKLDYIINNYRLLPSKIKEEINKNYSDIAKQIYNKNDIFFIGRNVDYALAMEGSLK